MNHNNEQPLIIEKKEETITCPTCFKNEFTAKHSITAWYEDCIILTCTNKNCKTEIVIPTE